MADLYWNIKTAPRGFFFCFLLATWRFDVYKPANLVRFLVASQTPQLNVATLPQITSRYLSSTHFQFIHYSSTVLIEAFNLYDLRWCKHVQTEHK